MHRRQVLIGAGGCVAAAMARPVMAFARDTDAILQAMLQAQAEMLLDRTGRTADNQPKRSGRLLEDRSLAARETQRRESLAWLAELDRIDATALSPAGRVDLQVARFVHESLADLLGRYGYVDINLRPNPYVVTQMSGAYYWLPTAIGSTVIANAADADFYLARLDAFASSLDEEAERIRYDAGLGVIPPDFVIATTIRQIESARDTPAADNALLGPAIAAAAKAGIDVAPRALALFRTRVAPALSRQAEALRALQPRATDVAGVWDRPDGAAYYASALRSNTTTRIAPGELHRVGLDLVASISAELDTLLRAEGLAQGSVGARIGALGNEPRFARGENDYARAEVIAEAEAWLAKTGALLPRAFRTIPGDPIEVRRIPPAIQDGAPGAQYGGGSRGEPGTFWINLKTVSEHPSWRLPTLVHHEGVPGHHHQSSVTRGAGDLSAFRRHVRFSSWTEGWALYSEQVAAEIGAYEADPLGRIGYLQSQLFRAGRIVVDTGMHHERWPREQAVRYMVDVIGEPRESAEREIDRYCVLPGQACSFMVGKQRIAAAREAARGAMGARFDVRDFHDFVLKTGPLPMGVMEDVVARWSLA